LEIINSLPTINLQEERKKYRLIKELSTVRWVHPIWTEVFVHFNTFSGSCEIYIEDNHWSFELAYFSKSESVYEYVEEIIKKTPTQVLEEMIEEYEWFCPEITDVLKDAINKINQ
jgi:hypothetical protein